METLITNNIIIIWIAVGVICLALEAMAVPGVGFLFAGLSAITVGGLINLGILGQASHIEQVSLFLAFVFVWAAILWIPLKNFSFKNEVNAFNNIVGDIAEVESDVLIKGKIGKVKWSGTIMRARLDVDDTVQSVLKGTEVYIKLVDGNTVTVTTGEVIVTKNNVNKK